MEPKIGFHARSMEELERVVNIDGVNLVEIKPEKFVEKDNRSIYDIYGEYFKIDEYLAIKVEDICDKKNVSIHLHVPYETQCNSAIDTGLCQSVYEHHELILGRYDIIGELQEKYGIGDIVTTHPPTFNFKYGNKIIDEEKAMKAGIELYSRIDKLIKKRGYGFKLGLENMVAPKKLGFSVLGYKPEQIDKLIGETSNIGITIDSGHRRLNDKMSIAKLFSYGKVLEVHFHSNPGKASDENYDDDEHVFANSGNLPHYMRYIKSIRRRHLPVILEIDKWGDYSDKELSKYVTKLRKEIEAKI